MKLPFKQVVAIHGVPRSGTSWLGQIINSSPWVRYRYQPLFSYAFKDRINPTSSRNEILAFFKELYDYEDAFLLQLDKIESGAYPKFEKAEVQTHLAYKEVRYHHILENVFQQVPEIKVIGIIRHPCAVINSWLKAPKEFKPEWDVKKEWRRAPSKNQNRPEEFYGFEKWKEVAEMFLRFREEYPEQFYLVLYRDLIKNTMEEVRKIFHFINLPVEKQTETFVAQSRSRTHADTYAVFRNKTKDVDWKAELPAFIREAIFNDLTGTKLEFLLHD